MRARAPGAPPAGRHRAWPVDHDRAARPRAAPVPARTARARRAAGGHREWLVNTRSNSPSAKGRGTASPCTRRTPGMRSAATASIDSLWSSPPPHPAGGESGSPCHTRHRACRAGGIARARPRVAPPDRTSRGRDRPTYMRRDSHATGRQRVQGGRAGRSGRTHGLIDHPPRPGHLQSPADDRPRPGAARGELARLRSRDDEVEAMAGELSKILEHIETINELDLEGVEPTSHVVDLENVLREDVPRPGLTREQALEQAPDATDGGSACPARAHRERRAARAHRRAQAAAHRGRRARARGAVRVLARARGRRRADAYLWVADEAPEDAGTAAVRSPSRTSSAWRACRAWRARGSSRATGRPTRPRRAQPHRRRARAARQDEHGRVRDGLVERELRLRPGEEPVGRDEACPAGRAAAAPPRWRPGRRRGRSAPTPAARSASRPRCAGSSGSSPRTARSPATG